jgi:hypothetical protein
MPARVDEIGAACDDHHAPRRIVACARRPAGLHMDVIASSSRLPRRGAKTFTDRQPFNDRLAPTHHRIESPAGHDQY